MFIILVIIHRMEKIDNSTITIKPQKPKNS